MSLTLAVWIGVYRMKVNEELSQLYFLDDSFNRTTGNATLDGLINGFGTICVLGCVSFMMLAFVLYDFRRIVKAWLTFSCILILFGVSGQTMYDLCLRVFDQNDDNQFLATVFFSVIPTLIYGSIGIYAFLADGSIFLHQFFVVANCSLISVFYLRAFPKHTTWFVLWTVLFWDLFAVLAPMGPLKKVQEKASDYSNNILKFLMFAAEERREVGGADEELNEERKMRKDVKQLIQMYTKKDAQDDEFLQKIRQRRTAINPDSGLTGHSPLVDTEPSPIQLKDRDSDEEKSDDEISSVSSSSSSSSDSSESIPSPSDVSTAEECAPEDWNQMVHSSPGYEPLTAADALNDGETVRLGFGDFVFYSLLIGQAATGGCPVAVAFAAIGILFGLVATLTVLSSEESTTPALPLPVICGTLFYFVSKMVMDHICI
uniref:Presenilin n=1 Tax=Caenorhabditis tropicalis TaxID=1561998 RepID=A0A1I7UKH8_9PELO